MQLNFDSYTKISDIVFDLVFNKFTLKLNVMFNETNKNKMTSEERQENLHNEYIVQKGTITTSLKYRYSLVLEIRGDFKNSFYLDWNNYDYFCTAVERLVHLADPSNPETPFKRKYRDTGELVDIKFDNLRVLPSIVKDRYGNVLEFIPFVLYGTGNEDIVTEAVKIIVNNEITFDIPIRYMAGFKRFLMTYNPLHHATQLVNYISSTNLIGSNLSKI